jgi:aspartyl protease family protein
MNERNGEQMPKRLGGGMVAAAWILALVLLTLLFGDFLGHQRNPNSEIISRQTGSAVEVVLEENRGHHYVATARINGRPVEVLLDTGASSISIPAGMAADMGLKRQAPMHVTTANGTVTVYATQVEEVRLGDIVLKDIRATINPHMQEDFVLLGMSFLKHLEFNQRDGRLILRQYL